MTDLPPQETGETRAETEPPQDPPPPKISDVLLLAHIVAQKAEASPGPLTGELYPGASGTVTVDTPLGLIDVHIEVPAPLRPNGLNTCLMPKPPERFDIDTAQRDAPKP